MALESPSVAIKSLKLVLVCDLIVSATQIYDWNQIQTHTQNLLSFTCSNQRINVWIEMKSMKITIRIQPMEYVETGAHISKFMDILKHCNELIESQHN